MQIINNSHELRPRNPFYYEALLMPGMALLKDQLLKDQVLFDRADGYSWEYFFIIDVLVAYGLFMEFFKDGY